MFLRWFSLLTFGLVTLALAQDGPVITIKKGDRIDIAVQTIGGGDGATVTSVLKNDLGVTDAFDVVSGGQAAFSIGGSSSGGSMQGTVTDAGGRTVINNTYSGSAREKAHRFADDVVETLTGRKGFASSKIALVGARSGRKEIYVADYDGANVQQLTRDGKISVSPSISPNGRQIAYTGYQSGYPDIYLIDLASGRRDRVVKFPGTNSGASFSPNGSEIAATLSKDGNPEIYVMSAGGGGARRVTRSPGADASPTWSPDGGELIYTSDAGGSPQLYRTSTRGGGARRLSTGQSYCTEPSWSPDGSKVAFNVRGGGGFQIAVLDLKGGGTRVLETGGNAEDPAWGADSRHLIYSSGSAIYLIDSVSGRKTKVIDGLGKVSEPSWSR